MTSPPFSMVHPSLRTLCRHRYKFDCPSTADRLNTLRVLTKKFLLEKNFSFKTISHETAGLTYAGLAALCSYALTIGLTNNPSSLLTGSSSKDKVVEVKMDYFLLALRKYFPNRNGVTPVFFFIVVTSL